FLFKNRIGRQDTVRKRLPFPWHNWARPRSDDDPFGSDHLPINFEDRRLPEADAPLDIVVAELFNRLQHPLHKMIAQRAYVLQHFTAVNFQVLPPVDPLSTEPMA